MEFLRNGSYKISQLITDNQSTAGSVKFTACIRLMQLLLFDVTAYTVHCQTSLQASLFAYLVTTPYCKTNTIKN